MGLFNRKSDEPKRPPIIRAKRGFRFPKRKQFTYEVDIEIEYKGRKIGIVPVKVNASSRANAKEKIGADLKFTPSKTKRLN